MPWEWLPMSLARLSSDLEPRWIQQVLEDPRPRWPRPVRHPTGIQLLEVWGRNRAGDPLIVTVRLGRHRQHTIFAARRMVNEEEKLFTDWEAELQ